MSIHENAQEEEEQKAIMMSIRDKSQTEKEKLAI